MKGEDQTLNLHGEPVLARYHRQSLLKQVGADGQRRLADRAALIIGCGALGTVALDALARAGVGMLIVVDRDLVEVTNLQRQTLFDEQDAADRTPKAIAAAERIGRINSRVDVVPIVGDVSASSIERLFDLHAARRLASDERASFDQGVTSEDEQQPPQLARLVDVVLDCTDNFQTRYLINDACVKHHVPMVYAGAIATGGMTMTCVPGITPCLRCVFPTPPDPASVATCDTVGVLGPAAGVVANLQAAEALKLLLGRADETNRSLREVDVWTGLMRSLNVSKARDAGCPCCGKREFEFLNAPEEVTVTLCGSGAVQVSPRTSTSVDLTELAARLAPHGEFMSSRYVLRGHLREEQLELAVFRDARALFTGLNDPARARVLYARYIGV